MAEENKESAMSETSVESENSSESSTSTSSTNDLERESESAHAIDQVELYLNSNTRSIQFFTY